MDNFGSALSFVDPQMVLGVRHPGHEDNQDGDGPGACGGKVEVG